MKNQLIDDGTPGMEDARCPLREDPDVHLRQLFAEDPTRGERLTAEAVGLCLDYSKNRITDETLPPARS